MKRHLLRTLAASSFLVLPAAPGFSQVSTARPAAPQPPPPAAVVAPSAPVAAPEKRFDIEFDAGTPAQEAIARLSEKLKQPINVIFTGDSAGTELPALRLHQVTLSEFFAAVRAAGQVESGNGRAGFRFAVVDEAPNIYTFTVDPPPPLQTNLAMPGMPGRVVGSQAVGGGFRSPPAREKASLFFDLSSILNDKLTIEDITTAIRTAWTAAEDGKEPPAEALKFHQETKLLIATGFPARLDTVTNIVKLLQERTLPSKDEKMQEIERLARDRAEARDQYDRMAKKLDQVEQEREVMVKDLRTRIAELEIELAKRQKLN